MSSGLGSINSLLLQGPGRLRDFVEQTNLVERQSNRARLLGKCLQNRLTNPPYGVRYELEALVLIEALGGSDETHVTRTDQIGERYTTVLVFLGDADDKTQIRLDEGIARSFVSILDFSSEVDFF